MRRRRQAEDPWLPRNLVLVLGLPILLVALTLGVSEPGSGWWLLASVFVALYWIGVLVAAVVASFHDASRN